MKAQKKGKRVVIQPQPGPQAAFLANSADVCVYGGAAGGGKSFGLLLDPLYHVGNPDFHMILFRRTFPQVMNAGGLWDTSLQIYPHAGAKPRLEPPTWRFPSGATVRFAHLQHEANVYDHQGAQYPAIGFDELTHFSLTQFLYLMSRNRSVSGIRPYIRATTNPDADSWVKRLLAPWVDDEHPEFPFAAGKLRWFTVENNEIVWVGREWRDENGMAGRSLSFVPASIFDNKILLKENPEYLSSLRAQSYVEQQRLLYGNWKVRPAAGKVFNRAWFEVVSVAPAGMRLVRFWDFAATEKALKSDDPDFTVGLLLGVHDGTYYVVDVVKEQAAPAEVKRLVKATAALDGAGVPVRWEQEPGSSGKLFADELVQTLAGFDARPVTPSGDKVQRAGPVAAMALGGRVKVVRAPWAAGFLSTLHGFPDLAHDDDVDALSGAFTALVAGGGGIMAAQVVKRERVEGLLG